MNMNILFSVFAGLICAFKMDVVASGPSQHSHFLNVSADKNEQKRKKELDEEVFSSNVPLNLGKEKRVFDPLSYMSDDSLSSISVDTTDGSNADSTTNEWGSVGTFSDSEDEWMRYSHVSQRRVEAWWRWWNHHCSSFNSLQRVFENTKRKLELLPGNTAVYAMESTVDRHIRNYEYALDLYKDFLESTPVDIINKNIVPEMTKLRNEVLLSIDTVIDAIDGYKINKYKLMKNKYLDDIVCVLKSERIKISGILFSLSRYLD